MNETGIVKTLTIWMCRGLNHPKGVWFHRVLVACHLLLLKTPVRQFDFMRKEVTASQGVPQPEDGPQRAKSRGRFPVLLVAVLDLDEPVIVRIPDEFLHSVGGDLILEIDIRDRRPEIVRVEVLFRDDMP